MIVISAQKKTYLSYLFEVFGLLLSNQLEVNFIHLVDAYCSETASISLRRISTSAANSWSSLSSSSRILAIFVASAMDCSKLEKKSKGQRKKVTHHMRWQYVIRVMNFICFIITVVRLRYWEVFASPNWLLSSICDASQSPSVRFPGILCCHLGYYYYSHFPRYYCLYSFRQYYFLFVVPKSCGLVRCAWLAEHHPYSVLLIEV